MAIQSCMVFVFWFKFLFGVITFKLVQFLFPLFQILYDTCHLIQKKMKIDLILLFSNQRKTGLGH